METTAWWYRCAFALPPALATGSDPLILRFDCLDTVAEIWLNDVRLGEPHNQHRPHEYDVTKIVAADNLLVVRFPPQLDGLLDDAEATQAESRTRARHRAVRPQAAELTREEALLPAQRSRLRKATFSWGWDFAARVPSVGIAGAVTIEKRATGLGPVTVRTTALDLTTRKATLTIGTAVTSTEADEIRIEVRAPNRHVTSAALPATADTSTDVALDDVEVWWTHDLGAQPLYDVDVTLHSGDRVVDVQRLRIGVRTIELDRSPDGEENARLFRFLLNGVPLFARGANWVPASLLVGSIPTSTYTGLVERARLANMNMLRMWGGGIYEPDVFYDACDEAGILVWQDFMFACFDYPTAGTDLEEETRREAAYQIERLRHHPSLALWCGNNEVQVIHQLVNDSVEPGDWGWSLWHELLPAVVAELDPTTPYWPGSPWGENDDEILNGLRDGDRHAWEVWHGLDLGAGADDYGSRGEAMHWHRFDRDSGRFISEFGIHASPELATLDRWVPAGTLELGNAAFDQRQKDTPKDKGWALMEYETGAPSSMSEYADYSMACQAEGLKHGIEHYRRRQPHCSGTLVWQYNDSWPGLSWSVIDYDLVPKAGYYFLQRVFQPVLASFRTTPAGLELWVTNSGMRDETLDLVVEVAGFDGVVDRREELAVSAGAYTSAPVWSTTRVPRVEQYAWVRSSGGTAELWPNRRFFGRLKELPLTGGGLTADIRRTGETAAQVELHASSYTYLARVMCSQPGALFSSNYLDLRAGDTWTIDVTGLAPGAELSVGSYGAPSCQGRLG
jgi:beta-mannosidase